MLFPGLCCWGEWYQLIQSNESSAVLKMVNLSYISHWCQILIQKLRDRFVWYLADILNTVLQLNKSQHRLAVTLSCPAPDTTLDARNCSPSSRSGPWWGRTHYGTCWWASAPHREHVGALPHTLPMMPAASPGPDQSGGPHQASPSLPQVCKADPQQQTIVSCPGEQLQCDLLDCNKYQEA